MDKLSDLEITRKCAEAMGIELFGDFFGGGIMAIERQKCGDFKYLYAPLRFDIQAGEAQVMALIKKFKPIIEPDPKRSDYWGVSILGERGERPSIVRHAPDLNRAICLCVATLHARK